MSSPVFKDSETNYYCSAHQANIINYACSASAFIAFYSITHPKMTLLIVNMKNEIQKGCKSLLIVGRYLTSERGGLRTRCTFRGI